MLAKLSVNWYSIQNEKGILKYSELFSYGSDRLFIIQNTNSYIVYSMFIAASIVCVGLVLRFLFFCAVLCILSSCLD